ncbi:MAG: TonB-dependent receptor domain-containing protein, partial [Gemmatimonadaceae bacterium]
MSLTHSVGRRVARLALAGLTAGLLVPAATGAVAAQAAAASGDSATVTGRVTTDGGAPVADAIVAIPSLRLSAVTNEGGVYRIPVPPGRFVARPDTLRVTRLGYRPATVQFTLAPGRVDVNVVLAEQAVALEQVLVTGTAGNQERRAQAAVVATIEASDVVRQAPVTTVTQLLQSRVPGVALTEGSGATGSATRLLVRGAASIALSNQPLVFIDGVRMDGGSRTLLSVSGSGTATSQAPSALNDLNPSDIESIEIVKGPAAATLYGADASAGVIQIITKRGRVGSRSFTQDVSLEYNSITPNFDVPTNYSRCIATLVTPTSPNPLCRNQTVGTIISDNPAERINAFRNGWMGAFDYSARGGGDNYGFYASVGITNEDGTTPNNTLQHRSGRGSFTFTPSDKLTFDLSFSLTRSEYELPRSDQDTYGYYVESAFGSALGVTEGPDGELTGGMLLGNATLESLSSIISRNTATRMMPTAQVRYAPVPWFTNRVTVGADLARSEGFQLFPKNPFGWYPDRLPFGNELTIIEADDRLYTVDYLGNIHAELGAEKQISTDLSFGSQYISRTNEQLAGVGQGLISNDATLVTNANTSSVAQGFGEQRSLGLFGQAQVGLNDRLFLQAGLRADRNSSFGSDVGTFYLPKFGASYVISEEPFWASLSSLVPTLRLRAAYGTTGRSPASGAIQTFLTSTFVNESGASELGVSPGDPGNPDLRP